MSLKVIEFQQRQTNLLGLVSLPLHLCHWPPGWLWDVEIVDLPALYQKTKLRQVTRKETLRLLLDLSDGILKTGSKDEADLPPLFKLTDKEAKFRSRFAQRIGELTAVERLGCCGHSKANVKFSDGRPLLLDPWHEGELLFGDDPIAWIRNGLWALDQRVLRSLPPTSLGFLPCPALTIRPCELPGGRKITTPTNPALYIGLRPVNQVIDEWRAHFWFQNIRDGYALAGERLQERWLQRVPNTSEPDPVYRFIREPSERLRDEALIFLRHAHDKVRGSKGVGRGKPHNMGAKPSPLAPRSPKKPWYHGQDEERPPEFKFGPLAGQKKELKDVCLQGQVDHRTFANACNEKDGGLWARALKKTESRHKFGVWFNSEPNFEEATKRLENLRKSKPTLDTAEGELADDSTEPAGD